MTSVADGILLFIAVLDVYIVAASRLMACVRATAIQGAALALLPIALSGQTFGADLGHIVFMSIGTLAVKGVVIPFLLFRSLRQADVYGAVEPFISQRISLVLAALLLAVSFWMATVLALPTPAPTMLLVPIAFGTLLIGFLVLVSRRKAIAQVVGYLVLENGIFIFGQMLLKEIPFAVELGILLDLLVGVFVMGIAIHHISQEFEHIDTEQLASLKD